MISCRNCGKQIDERSTACPFCGTPINVAQPQYAQPQQAQYAQQVQQAQYAQQAQQAQYAQPQYAGGGYDVSAKKSKKGLLIGLIAGAVVMILALVLCFSLCGSSWALEPGMSISEVNDAMSEEGFYYDSTIGSYIGSLDDVGKVSVKCSYNDSGELYCVVLEMSESYKLRDFLLGEVGGYDDEVFCFDRTGYRYDNDGVLSFYTSGSSVVSFAFEEYLKPGDSATRNEIVELRAAPKINK